MKRIKNIEKYLKIIKKFYETEGCGGIDKIYYRGQSDSAYKLIPSLSHRLDGYTEDDENYIAFESKIVNEAKLEYPNIFADNNFNKDLKEKGYILNYKFEQDGVRSNIKIALKYHPETKAPAIRTLTRVSKPGLRRYTNVEDMPRVLNGLGIAILSTSLGVMSDKEARQKNVGGEVLCYVY